MQYSFFGDQVHDKEMQKWVYTKLKMRRCRFKQRYEDFFFKQRYEDFFFKQRYEEFFFKQRYEDFFFPKVQVNRGNKRVSSEIEQKIFDLWLENSEISVDRRDGRDVVDITAKVYASRYGGVVCQHLIYGSKKRNVDIKKHHDMWAIKVFAKWFLSVKKTLD